ncbi:MAG: hypothetical protein AAB354_06630, partial [candidate division KSB1 bacterium]
DHLRPVYLIFDQFEELFILGSKEEQQIFIRTIAALLKSEVACKIIFAMREEYLAMLYDFEKAVPSLFNKRFRVEPMSLHNVQQVITGTTAAFGIKFEHGDKTAQQIIDNLSDHRAGVQLSYLQVYLDKLYREAAHEQNGRASDSQTPIIFTEQLVRQTGALGDVMADFLEEQTAVIQKALATKFPQTPAETVKHVLEEFATLEGTKQPITRAELAAKLEMSDSVIEACLMALENSRILRNIEGVYELAHDTLAGRIADKRSVERKNLLKVQKLIKDRHSAFEQTRTYLNKEELAFINPHLAKLNLNEQEYWFVNRSESLAKWKQRRLTAGTIGIMAVLISLTIWAFFSAREAEQQRNIANENLVKAENSAREAKQLRAFADSLARVAEQQRDTLEYFIDKKFITAKGSLKAIQTEPQEFLSQLRQIMPKAPEPNLKKFIEAFNHNLDSSKINTPLRLAAFLAQIARESHEFKWRDEGWGPTPAQKRYEPPSSLATALGNVEPGDGRKYRGRGLFKITGRSNYQKYSEISGYDLVANPDQASTVEVSTALACILWKRNGLNEMADAGMFTSITRRINGGLYALDERLKYYNRALEVLKVK